MLSRGVSLNLDLNDQARGGLAVSAVLKIRF